MNPTLLYKPTTYIPALQNLHTYMQTLYYPTHLKPEYLPYLHYNHAIERCGRVLLLIEYCVVRCLLAMRDVIFHRQIALLANCTIIFLDVVNLDFFVTAF